MDLEKKLEQAAQYLKENCPYRPKVGIILGSGLGSYGDTLVGARHFLYEQIPHFPVSTVEGHAGRFVITDHVICMQGRFHFYEGYDMNEVTFPIYVMKLLGVEKLIVTNAAGGINTAFDCGDLMLITDHINLCGKNPLIGKNLDSFGLRFPDMSQAYSKELLKMAKTAAEKSNLDLKEGVYMYFTGPSFETPAEIRAARILGADAAGMSTVPEVIVANHCGIEVLGISCITNMAAGVLQQPLSHVEVIETTEKVKQKFIELVKNIVEEMVKSEYSL